MFHIVLHQPDIHWNTGAIGRTCVALGAELILIHPLGFSLDDRQVKRSGLDYWEHVKLKEYDSWEHFLEAEKPEREQFFFFSSKASNLYYDADYQQGCYLVFGAETRGLPAEIMEAYSDRAYTMPMFSEHIRSLNLANAATAVAYEALRKIAFCG